MWLTHQLHRIKTNRMLLLPKESANPEDSKLSDKLIRCYGIRKSQTLTSSVFTSPIGQDRYRLFEPLTGDSHNTVQQAHGLTGADDDVTPWCTRWV